MMWSRKNFLIAIAVALLCLLGARAGASFAILGYVPDFCWLWRTGQIILKNGAVPSEEPFSFALQFAAYAGDVRPYIVYQWLSEVLFCTGIAHLGSIGLLAAVAIISTATYTVLPLLSGLRFNISLVWLFCLVILVGLSENLREYVRPEVFSFFLTALLLCILQQCRLRQTELVEQNQSENSQRFELKTVVQISVLILLACNIHVGFVVDLVLLLMYSAALSLDSLKKVGHLSAQAASIGISTLLAFPITCLNPAGIRLWQHMPYLLNSPLTSNISENQPITIFLIEKENLYIPFVLLVFFAAVTIFITLLKSIKAGRLRETLSFSAIASLILITASCDACLHRARMVALAALIVGFELPAFVSNERRSLKLESFGGPRSRIVFGLVFAFLISASAVYGVFSVANQSSLITLPMARPDFLPPFGGIKYLAENYRGDKLYADIEFADMCEMYLPHPSIFEDTRFDGYDLEITSDYARILTAEAHWKEILDAYGPNWVFVRPNAEIIGKLSSEPNWKLVYQDKACVIFRRGS